MGSRSSQWVSLRPYGLGFQKPNHYWEILKTLWENRDQLGFAWRILTRGVCDGCALGAAGLKDWTVPGPHLCTLRLNLLRINTMPPLDLRQVQDVRPLQNLDGKTLREMGRLPYPLLRKKGDPGFQRIRWNQAFSLIADYLRKIPPERWALYMTARGITNETYYVAQKVARFLGTNNIDNASRICHSPSTVALKQALGVSASTCSYADWIGTDLIVLIGTDMANNQPVTTKYLYYAKKKGTRVLVINPLQEPGLKHYWIPSILESALFGTPLADEFFPLHTGGDIAFFNGVLKHLIAIGGMREDFIQQHTTGWEELEQSLREQSWEFLEQQSGASRQEMARFAEIYAQAKTAVFVWSMGITQHSHGVQNVRAIINLALARGMVGREKCGLMPIRGHSGVQGSAECGAIPNALPGGVSLNDPEADRIEELWGFPIPRKPGLTALEMAEAAEKGELDLLYCIGGNFLNTLPDTHRVKQTLTRIPLRIHQDIVLNESMLLEPGEMVLILPSQTRYEMPGGVTETTTERRILFSPEIPGRRIGEALPEWEIPMQIAEAVLPEKKHLIHFDNSQQIREELAQVNPTYRGIEKLKKAGDMVQWGGPRLCEGWHFPTPDGKAHFMPLYPPSLDIPPGHFLLSTRRGKQFNSMVLEEKDPLTGAPRSAILISPEDAQRLGLRQGDKVKLRSEAGELVGTCYLAPLRPGNLQVFWPEGNVLIPKGEYDPLCKVPDYNTLVTIEILKPECAKNAR